MRIFLIPTAYPNNDNRTANNFIFEQVQALKKNNEIIVLHVQNLPSRAFLRPYNSSYEKYNDTNTEVFHVKNKTLKFFRRLNRRNFTRKQLKLYEMAVAEYGKPDMLYAHFSDAAGYSASVISKKHGIPLVVEEHDGDYLNPKPRRLKLDSLQKAYAAASAFLCVSQNLSKCVSTFVDSSDKITVTPNMLTREYKYFEKSRGEIFSFLSVARLDRDKRLDLLIEAFCEAFEETEPVRLVIAGGGKEQGELSALVKSKNRANQIIMTGRLDRSAILEEYKKCDCFVLPTRYETFGIVFREAMAVGRPIITTKHKGFSDEEWNNTFGIRIDIDSKSQLIDALKHMRTNINDYDGRYISEKCLSLYNEDKIIPKIEEIFKNVVMKGYQDGK